MPSSKMHNLRVCAGGVDRSAQSFLLSQNTIATSISIKPFSYASFQTLLNFRPYRKQLIQTPPLVSLFALTALGGVAAGQIREMQQVLDSTGTLQYFILDEATARYVLVTNTAIQVQVPFVLQIAVPNRADVTGQCLLFGITTTNFSAANDQIDVQIVDGTHFQWRKNGGAWTGPLVIAATVSIGSGLSVSFISNNSGTYTGYTAADTWSWKRTTTPYAGTYPSFVVQTASYARDLYVAGYDRNVLRLRGGALTTVGYKRIYGKYVAEFYNHIVVAHFAEGVYDAGTGVADSYDATSTPWRLAWSDLNNPDEFFSTLFNEADGETIPSRSNSDATSLGITGLAGLNNLLFAYLANDICSVTYLGLPNVMQVDPLHLNIGSIFQGGVVATPNFHYFIGEDNFYSFNGSTLSPIGFEVREQFFAEVAPSGDARRQRLYGVFDVEKSEVVWTYWQLVAVGIYQGRQVVYQPNTQTWYFRNVPSVSSSGSDLRALTKRYNNYQALLWGANALVLADATTANLNVDSFTLISGPAFTFINGVGFDLIPQNNILKDAVDANGVSSYTLPQIETQDIIYEDVFSLKQLDSLFIDGGFVNSDGLQVEVSANKLLSSTPNYVTQSQVWVPSLVERRLSFPTMLCGSVFRFRLTFKSSSQVIGAYLSVFGEFVYGYREGAEA